MITAEDKLRKKQARLRSIRQEIAEAAAKEDLETLRHLQDELASVKIEIDDLQRTWALDRPHFTLEPEA